MNRESGPPDGLDIASEFPPNTFEEWKTAVEETLKGVPFDKAMTTKTYEGIDLQPIYCMTDIQDLPHLNSFPGHPPYVRGNTADGHILRSWIIAQEQNHPDPTQANRIILDELNKGLTAVNLKLDRYTKWATLPVLETFHPDGIWLNGLDDLRSLLKGVNLSAVPLLIKTGEAGPVILSLINAYCKENKIGTETLTGLVGFDLITSLLEDRELPFPETDKWVPYYQMITWATANSPKLRTILLDGHFWGSRGADALTELAYLVSAAAEYINALLDTGMTMEKISPSFQINLNLGSNLFMEIAKVRAARLLWSELMRAYGANPENRKVWIHGVTSAFNKTIYEPYVNILRTATESFSGVIGGLDSLEVSPFDFRIKPDDEFSRRVARNQQILLEEESHLNKVIDPAGGCFYIEKLTSRLAEDAWSKMQKIVAEGGLFQAVLAGRIQAEVRQKAQERKQNVDMRKDVFVGVNMFANPLEQPLELTDDYNRKDLEERYESALAKQEEPRPGLEEALQKLSDHGNYKSTIDLLTEAMLLGATLEEAYDRILGEGAALTTEALPRCHATGDFEALRSRIDQYKQSSQTRLFVFLANMGPLSQHKARADFAMGFFQAGGFEVQSNDGFTTAEEAIEAALQSGAKAVCICSTDDTYSDWVPQLAGGIKKRKQDMTMILAGFPKDMAEKYAEQGIDIFIHIKANALEALTSLANRMGVEA